MERDTNALLGSLSSLGFSVNHAKSVLFPTQHLEYLGLKINVVSFRAFLSQESGEISPAPQSVSPAELSLVTSLPPPDGADDLSNFCHSSGVVKDVGFPTLGVLSMSGDTTSSQSNGKGFPVMSPGSFHQGMATPWALFRGISVSNICATASWASPHTFIWFYRLDMTVPSPAHSVLSVGSC